MSKAFLRENDEQAEPVLATPVSTLPPGAANYITRDGLDRLRQELRRLKLEQRPDLLRRSAEDAEAKAALAQLDQRIRRLQQSSLTADVVDPPREPTDTIRFGATVSVKDAAGTVVTYRLVGVDETDATAGAISWVSPLAQALLNRRPGEHVEITTPTGQSAVTILDVRYG